MPPVAVPALRGPLHASSRASAGNRSSTLGAPVRRVGSGTGAARFHFQAEDEARNELFRCFNDTALPLDVRVAAALVRLYALPLTRSIELTEDHISRDQEHTYLAVNQHPFVLPPKLARLIDDHQVVTEAEHGELLGGIQGGGTAGRAHDVRLHTQASLGGGRPDQGSKVIRNAQGHGRADRALPDDPGVCRSQEPPGQAVTPCPARPAHPIRHAPAAPATGGLYVCRVSVRPARWSCGPVHTAGPPSKCRTPCSEAATAASRSPAPSGGPGQAPAGDSAGCRW